MTVLGWIAVHLLFALVGGALLAALGLIKPTRRGLLLALGPAYITGVACVTLALIIVMVVGLPFTDVTLLVTVAILTGGFAVVAIRRGDWARRLIPAIPPRSSAERWAVVLIAAAAAVFVVVAGGTFIRMPTNWDPAHMWQLRAGTIYYWHGLVSDVFTNVARFGPYHMDYPIAQATFEAAIFHGLGGEYIQWIHVELWGLFVASLWTAGYLLAPGRRMILWLPVLAALALGPVEDTPIQGNADLTVAMFTALGVLGVGLWLERRHFEPLVLGGLFLAAAANTKKEGLVFVAMIAVALVAVWLIRRRWRELRPMAVVLGGALLLIVPWLAYVRIHHLPSGDTVPLHTILSRGYLTGRLYRLSAAQTAVLGQFTNSGWAPVVPLLLVLGGACFIARRLRRVAAFYILAVTLMTCALLWIYWTENWPNINDYLALTVGRTILSIFAVATVAVAHLAAGISRGGDRIAMKRTTEDPVERSDVLALTDSRS